MTDLDDGIGLARSAEHPRRSLDPDSGRRLMLGDVRLPRAGAADPVERAHWLLRETWDDHRSRAGTRPAGGLWLVDVLEEAELTGRGGGFFPTARKWRAALARPRGATVVANASESEPLSAKDATLVRQRPHLVLDGLALAAESLGAVRAVVWLHADDVVTRLVVEDAAAERRRAGLPECDVEIVTGPATYVSGESSAIEQALAGGPALPMFRGFGPHARGRADHPPTVVHNVETLARIALLARDDSADPRRGRARMHASLQSTVLTVLTAAERWVIEEPAGGTVAQVIADAGWTNQPRAVLLGGFGGVWARPGDVAAVAVQEPALRSAGATLGAGVIAPLPAASCGVAETAAIVGYLARSSARQCGPCLYGLASVASRLDELSIGRARRSGLRRIAADLDAVRGRGACHHPDGATRLIASALDVFADDFAAHAGGQPCAWAGVGFIPVPAAG